MQLQDVRIRNYRSIEAQDVCFGDTTVLFGKNDAGKSNVVKALEFAFDRSRQVDISSVHISSSCPDPKDTSIIVDVRFVGDIEEDIQWLMAFSSNPFNIGNGGELSLSYRTEAAYSPETRTFEKSRRIINDWDGEELGDSLPPNLLDSIDFILLDAHRDIAELVRDRYSRWNQEVRKADISEDEAEEMETKLKELGESIVKASPFLTTAQNDLKGSTDHRASKVEVAPVARSLNELYRSLDVLVTEDTGPSISMALFGAGTRSRAEFMAYKALIDIAERDTASNGKPYYCLAVFEEPEAHVHPQSQQQLLIELNKLGTQRIVTTHSPYLLAKAPMSSLMHVRREDATTVLTTMDIDLTDDQRKDTERYLLRTHGELLFADAVVFAEGETEEQALPVFFRHHFGKLPFECGITVASVAGHNYEPYLCIAKKLGISWFILSDAETHVLNDVKKQIAKSINDGAAVDLSHMPQVITCRPKNDFEKDLIDDGYVDEMIAAINAVESSNEVPLANCAQTFFEGWMQKTHGSSQGRYKTDRVCETCHQNIYEERKRDYSSEDGLRLALIDFMDNGKNKVRYATAIAEQITSLEDKERTVPTCVKRLFDQIDTTLHILEGK